LLAYVGQSSIGDTNEVPNETMVVRIGDVVCVRGLLHAATG